MEPGDFVERAFTVGRLPALDFGAGVLEHLPERIVRDGHRAVAIVTGGRSVRGREQWSPFVDDLVHHDITLLDFTVRGEPSPEVVDAVVRQIREDLPDCSAVVAIGGGSVIDCGKATAAAVTKTGRVADYLEGVGTQKPPGTTLPVYAVPTTAGTGSEATKNAVLSSVGTGGFKKSLRHDRFVPVRAVLDPTLYVGCPDPISRAAGLDAVTQLLESYASSEATPFTDVLVVQGLRLAGSALPRIVNGTAGVDDWGRMAYAAYLGGVGLANAGLGVVHGIASPMGARRDIPHGVVCGLLIGPATRKTLHHLTASNDGAEARRRYGTAASALNIGDGSVEAMIDWFDAIAEPLGRFRDYGFTGDDLGEIAHRSGMKNHPVRLSNDEVEAMLRIRL
jgi:alcohol dehydrogenase class IV